MPSARGPGVAVRLTQPIAAWLILAGSVSLYLALSLLVWHEPFYVGGRHLRYYDLRVYRAAAHLVLEGRPLYASGLGGLLPFTYPPFAALVFVPVAVLPLLADEVLFTGLNLIACLLLLRATLELADRPPRPRAWGLAALGTAAAIWLEPVSTTIGYGQIDLMLVALILFDLTRGRECRTQGVAIGLAAGMKLTPLLFVAYLALTRRARAASRAGGTFALTVAAGFLLLPGDAAEFWTGTGFRSSRVGTVTDTTNQSLHGLLARVGPPAADTLWLVAAAGCALAGLAAATRAARRGDEATGVSLCILTALLVSPISWTHHWALALPALFLLARRGLRQRSRPKLAAAVILAAAGYAYLPELATGASASRDPVDLLAANPYVVLGLIALATGCARLLPGGERPGRARPA